MTTIYVAICRALMLSKNVNNNKLAVVPYEYQFVCFHDNVIKLASKLNHNCDNLTGATFCETFPPINLQSISSSPHKRI